MGDQIWPKMKMKLNKAERICFRTDFGNEKKNSENKCLCYAWGCGGKGAVLLLAGG